MKCDACGGAHGSVVLEIECLRKAWLAESERRRRAERRVEELDAKIEKARKSLA